MTVHGRDARRVQGNDSKMFLGAPDNNNEINTAINVFYVIIFGWKFQIVVDLWTNTGISINILQVYRMIYNV